MESEKITYWVTLGVLALATTTGFVTGHQGWGDGLAERSIAMMSQASEEAMNYVQIAHMLLGSAETGSDRSPRSVIEVHDYVQNQVQARLACVQRTMVRRQAEMARLQAVRVQARLLERPSRVAVWANPNVVIQAPQPPQPQVDTF